MWLWHLVVTWTLLNLVVAKGGELAYFATPPMSAGVTHRQNVCERYHAFRNKTIRSLRDGLQGLNLNVVFGSYEGSFFNYDEVTGIDSTDPGLVAVLMDELARRAGFSWRDSFGIYQDATELNTTWSELLSWTVDNYDVTADWWAVELERINSGVAFPEGFLDSSLMLVSKKTQEETNDNEINLWNWLKPYDVNVWLMTIATIFLSAAVYQVLEWFDDDRQGRTFWDWYQENAYMSLLNFTQAYEYQPKSFAGRLFGVSMAVWALVMTGEYLTFTGISYFGTIPED